MPPNPRIFSLLNHPDLRAIIQAGQAADDNTQVDHPHERKAILHRALAQASDKEQPVIPGAMGDQISQNELRAFVHQVSGQNPSRMDQLQVTHLTNVLYHFGSQERRRPDNPTLHKGQKTELNSAEIHSISLMIKMIEEAFYQPDFAAKIQNFKDVSVWVRLINCLAKIKSDWRYQTEIASFELSRLNQRVQTSVDFVTESLRTPDLFPLLPPTLSRGLSPDSAKQVLRVLQFSHDTYRQKFQKVDFQQVRHLRDRLAVTLMIAKKFDNHPAALATLEEIQGKLSLDTTIKTHLSSPAAQNLPSLLAIFYPNAEQENKARFHLQNLIDRLDQKTILHDQEQFDQGMTTLRNLLYQKTPEQIIGAQDLYYIKDFLIATYALSGYTSLTFILPYTDPVVRRQRRERDEPPYTSFHFYEKKFTPEDVGLSGLKVHFTPDLLMVALADVIYHQSKK